MRMQIHFLISIISSAKESTTKPIFSTMGLSIQISSEKSPSSVFRQLKKSISMSSPFSEKKKSIQTEEGLSKKIRRYNSDSSLQSGKMSSHNSTSSLKSESTSTRRLSAALEEIESFEKDFVEKLKISETTDENNN